MPERKGPAGTPKGPLRDLIDAYSMSTPISSVSSKAPLVA